MIAKPSGRYSFPSLTVLAGRGGRGGEQISPTPEQAALAEAVARGYADGFAQGRAEAEVAAKAALEAARAEAVAQGQAQGLADGLAEMQRAAAALTKALAGVEEERAALARECEAFCVEVAMAVVARLVETSEVHAAFVRRAVAAALKALAPEPPSAIFLNPADRRLVQKALAGLPIKNDETLASGEVRVEAGRLLVEAGIDAAFEQIRGAVLEVKTRRARARSISEKPRA